MNDDLLSLMNEMIEDLKIQLNLLVIADDDDGCEYGSLILKEAKDIKNVTIKKLKEFRTKSNHLKKCFFDLAATTTNNRLNSKYIDCALVISNLMDEFKEIFGDIK